MSWSQEELVAAAYAVVFVFVLVYVAIIAAKLVRLQRETEELVELARARGGSGREPGLIERTGEEQGDQPEVMRWDWSRWDSSPGPWT